MLSDTKRVQTILNLLNTRVVDKIVDADAIAGLLRQAVIDNKLAGQFPTKDAAALQSFVADLSKLAESPIVVAIKNRYVPSHRNAALTIPGVN